MELLVESEDCIIWHMDAFVRQNRKRVQQDRRRCKQRNTVIKNGHFWFGTLLHGN